MDQATAGSSGPAAKQVLQVTVTAGARDAAGIGCSGRRRAESWREKPGAHCSPGGGRGGGGRGLRVPACTRGTQQQSGLSIVAGVISRVHCRATGETEMKPAGRLCDLWGPGPKSRGKMPTEVPNHKAFVFPLQCLSQLVMFFICRLMLL